MDGAAIDDLITQWRCGAGGDIDLHEFLGWSLQEYEQWVVTCQAPVRA